MRMRITICNNSLDAMVASSIINTKNMAYNHTITSLPINMDSIESVYDTVYADSISTIFNSKTQLNLGRIIKKCATSCEDMYFETDNTCQKPPYNDGSITVVGFEYSRDSLLKILEMVHNHIDNNGKLYMLWFDKTPFLDDAHMIDEISIVTNICKSSYNIELYFAHFAKYFATSITCKVLTLLYETPHFPLSDTVKAIIMTLNELDKGNPETFDNSFNLLFHMYLNNYLNSNFIKKELAHAISSAILHNDAELLIGNMLSDIVIKNDFLRATANFLSDEFTRSKGISIDLNENI